MYNTYDTYMYNSGKAFFKLERLKITNNKLKKKQNKDAHVMVAEKERKNTISKIRMVQWWENLLPNKPLSRRSRSPRPPLLPQIQRDLGCNSVLPRINCSEWILHLASSVSRGFRFRRNVSPNEDTCLVQGITTRDHGYLSNFRIRLKEITGRGDDGGRFSSIYKANKFSQLSFIHLDRLGEFGGHFWDNARDSSRGGLGGLLPPPARLQ